MIGDQVRLQLPADPAYGRVARITASSLALRVGLPFTQVDQLRLAIDEALVLLLRSEPADGRIQVLLTVRADGLALDLAGTPGSNAIASAADLERFTALVAPIVDVAEVGEGGHAVHLECHRAAPVP